MRGISLGEPVVFQSKVKRLALRLFTLGAVVLLTAGRIGGDEIRKRGETGGPSGAPVPPATAGGIRISVDGPLWAPAGCAIPLMLRIEDPNGALVEDPGLRVTLVLGGSAIFVQGATTNRALVEFVEGRVTVE